MSRVGSAWSEYRLDLRPFEQDIQTIRRRLGEVRTEVASLAQGVPTGLGNQGGGAAQAAKSSADAWTQLQRAQAGLEAQSGDLAAAEQRLSNVVNQQTQTTTQSIAVQRQLLTVQQQQGAAEQRAAQQSLQLAQARARALTATGHYADAERVLTQELQKQSQVTPQVVAAQNQLQQVQARSAQGTRDSVTAATQLRGALSGLTQAFGALGLAVGLSAIVNFAKESINAANTLQKTEATVRALSGSQQRYNEVLQLARQGQTKYGGSLSDNLEGLGSLVNLSNRAGASLSQLDNVSRRLAIIDPLQGIKGATVALKEFLTGSDATAIQSLVRRFELPKSALRALTDESLSAGEKLEALDKVLADQGITQEVLSNRINTTAATYDRAAAATDNLKVSLGGLLAQGLEPAARGWANMAQATADNLAALGSFQSQLDGVNNSILQSAGSYDEYARKIQFVNDQLPFWKSGLDQLTPSQYAFAQSLLQSGASIDEVNQKLASTGDVSQLLATQLQAVGGASTEVGSVLAEAGGQMVAISTAAPDAADQVIGLAGAFAAGEITSDQFLAALDTLQGGYERQAQAVSALTALEEYRRGEQTAGTNATRDEAAAADEAALASYRDTQAKQAQTLQHQLLAQQAQATADAFLRANPGISEAGIRAQIAAGLIPQMTGELAILTQQILAARAALGTKVSGPNVGFAGANRGGRIVKARETAKEIQEARELAKANEEYQRALGNVAPGINRVKQELSALTPGTAAYTKKLTELTRLEQERDRLAKKGGGGGKGRADAQGKVLNQLEDQEIKYQQRMEDAAEDHAERIAAIEQKYYERRLKAEKAFSQQQKDSRADFYESLADIEDQGLRKALSEKYEQVQQEAAAIRDKYGAEAAAAYEEEATKIAEAEVRLRDKINKLRSATDEEGNKKSKEQREKDLADAEYLEGVLALKQKAAEERLKDLRDPAETAATERQEELNKEAERYGQQQDQIAESSDRATDKIERNAQRRKIAIDEENKSLSKTAAYYDRLQGNQPSPVTAPAAPPSPGSPAAAPPPAQTDKMTAVYDQTVVDILGSTNNILTAGFGGVREDLGQVITRLRAVEQAVRSWNGATR